MTKDYQKQFFLGTLLKIYIYLLGTLICLKIGVQGDRFFLNIYSDVSKALQVVSQIMHEI